jgi:hypothetical protein
MESLDIIYNDAACTAQNLGAGPSTAASRLVHLQLHMRLQLHGNNYKQLDICTKEEQLHIGIIHKITINFDSAK